MLDFFREQFVPCEANGHKPHVLRTDATVFVAAMLIVAEAVFLIQMFVVVPHVKLFGIVLTNALVDETNAARMSNDLPALKTNATLEAAARLKAADMVKNNYFAHTSPAGISPWHWFVEAGYNFSTAGENLAVNFSDSEDVTNAWMNSPGHRANILNNKYTEFGIATADGTFDGHSAVYVVQLFGAPVENAPLPIVAVAPSPKKFTPIVASGPTAPIKAPAPVIVKAPNGADQFAVVKGAETNAQPVPVVASVPTPVADNTQINLPAPLIVPESHSPSALISAPRNTLNFLFFGAGIAMLLALLINILVKIKIQSPRLIMNGMAVMALALLLFLLNHYLALAAIKIV